MRGLPGSRTLCLIIIQGDLPGACTLCLMNTKEGCLTPPGTLRIWQNIGDLREKKVWYILLVPSRFLENMGTHIFFRKGVPHTTRQLSGLWKNWAPSVDFFYGHNPNVDMRRLNLRILKWTSNGPHKCCIYIFQKSSGKFICTVVVIALNWACS